LVEQLIRNQQVTSSSLVAGSRNSLKKVDIAKSLTVSSALRWTKRAVRQQRLVEGVALHVFQLVE
jgi:hypothetical protein